MASFTPEQKEWMTNIGESIGSALQDRFNMKQAEDFVSNELAQFQAATSAFHQSLGQIEDPDQMGMAFLDWKNNTFMPFLTQSALRYQKNPRIMEVVSAVNQANMEGMDQFMGFKKDAADLAQTEATTQLRGAQTQEAQAGVEERQARTGLLRAQTAAVGQEGQGGMSQKDLMEKFPIPPGSNPMEQRLYARQADPKRAQPVDENTIRQAALRFVEQNRGMPTRPDGREWGATPSSDEISGAPGDLEVAADMIQQSPAYQKLIEAGRISAWAGPEALHQHQGYYDDVLNYFEGQGTIPMPEELSGKLRGSQDSKTIVSMLTATPKSAMRGLEFESVDEFISNQMSEMQKPSDLGPTFQSMFDAGARLDEFQTPRAYDGTEIKDYSQLQQKLYELFHTKILDNLVSNDQTTSSTRKEAEKLGVAAVKRFTPLVAQRLGIEIPRRQEDKSITGSLLEGIGVTTKTFKRRLFGSDKTTDQKPTPGKRRPTRTLVPMGE